MELRPFAGRLDLSENLVLLMYPGGVAIADARPAHECSDAPHWVCEPREGGGAMAVYMLAEALVETEDGLWQEPTEVTPVAAHEAYGNRVLQSGAVFGSARAEDWTLRVDPLQVGFDWIRQPHTLGGRCAFRVRTPAAANEMQFWRTSEGAQTAPLAPTPGDTPAWAGEASGVLLYSEAPRAALRLDVAVNGPLSIGISPEGVPAWQLDWTVAHGQLVRLSGNFGLRAAARRFYDVRLPDLADASADFGSHYDQLLLGSVALVTGGGELPRTACLPDSGQATLGEVALACETLGLCAPVLTASLLRESIQRELDGIGDTAVTQPDLLLPVEARPALLLLMAGRYLRLTGDLEFISASHAKLRHHAEGLLALRRPSEALPLFTIPGQPNAPVKLPGATALVYAALSRWGAIEVRLGSANDGDRFSEAAFAMQWAAIAPLETGGLWHLGRGSFVSCLPASGGRNSRVDPQTQPGAEFDFGQQALAFWLGLCPEDDLVRRSMEWVDYTYTYAAGRGGPVYPPGYKRTWHALLDVAVRLRYGCGDVAPILQRTVDVASRAGLPFSRWVRGPALPAGGLLDAAPYFEIIFQRHYGLDYDAGGWRLKNPRPLSNYPLTRVKNLRHKSATYAVTWQGRGTIQRVTLNGAPHPTRVLDKATGEHEVLVTLA